jgi:hypothetical protein
MGVGIAIGGLASGIAQGLKLGSDIEDAAQRRTLAKESAERDKARFKFETEESEDKSRRRTELKAAEDELKAADEMLAKGNILGGQQQPVAPTAAIANPNAAPMQGAMPAPSPAAGAIAMPDAAPAQAQQTSQPNPFMTGAEGKYQDPKAAMDRYYDMKAAALSKVFRAKGDYDKAELVPKMMNELRDQNWSQKVGTSLAAMAGNAPGAREAFGKVYGMVNDGYELDPASGKFDPDKGWTGLERINTQTGKRETFSLSPEQAAAISSRYKDPAQVISFVLERADKAKSQALEGRKVAATEKSADAEVTKAGASVVAANAQASRASALNKREQAEANGQQQKAMTDAILRQFPLATKEFKEEELMGKDADAKRAKKAAEERMANKTLDLAGLNPKIDVRTLAGIARAGKVDAQQDADGRVFTMVGDKKIFLQ